MADDFYLFANCNFVPDRYADWQAAYDDLAKYVWSSEPTTKTYYFGIPIDYAHDFSRTTSMFAFEVYGKREDLYTTHLNSPSMSHFLTLIPAASTTGLDLNHYRLISGFLDLPGDASSAGIMQDMRISCSSPSSRASLLSSLSSFVSSLHSESSSSREESLKDGILTYMAFECLDDDVGVRIFGRWRMREDMERFIRREDAVGFWMGNKEGVRAMEQRLYVENGKGWLHRGKQKCEGKL